MKKVLGLLAVVGTATAAQATINITNSVAGTFVDIRATGTVLNTVASNDDCSYSFTNPLTTGLFTSPTVRVCSNGFVQFGGASGATAFTNASIITSGNTVTGSTAPQALMPFWDDLVANNRATDVAQSRVLWQTGTAASFGLNPALGNVLIIQWSQMDHFSTNTTFVTFEAQFYSNPIGVTVGTTSTGGPIDQLMYAQMLYSSTLLGGGAAASDNGGSATIGYHNGTTGPGGENSVQWSFNSSAAPAGARAGNVLTVVPAPGSVALLGLGGLVAGRRRRA